MMAIDFNKYLLDLDTIMIFPAYVKRINLATYNIHPEIIADYLFMYGKNKPCINGNRLTTYRQYDPFFNIRRIIRKYKFKRTEDYVVINGDYLLTPKAYYSIIFSSDDFDLINQFNKLFIYEYMYEKYLNLKNQ